jgi:hypothetical protein
MKSDRGETIFTTCDRCHVILAQGDEVAGVGTGFSRGLAFVHPEDENTIEV